MLREREDFQNQVQHQTNQRGSDCAFMCLYNTGIPWLSNFARSCVPIQIQTASTMPEWRNWIDVAFIRRRTQVGLPPPESVLIFLHFNQNHRRWRKLASPQCILGGLQTPVRGWKLPSKKLWTTMGQESLKSGRYAPNTRCHSWGPSGTCKNKI